MGEKSVLLIEKMMIPEVGAPLARFADRNGHVEESGIDGRGPRSNSVGCFALPGLKV